MSKHLILSKLDYTLFLIAKLQIYSSASYFKQKSF